MHLKKQLLPIKKALIKLLSLLLKNLLSEDNWRGGEKVDKEKVIDNLIQCLAFDNKNFAFSEKDKKIALDILESLSKSDITIARAKEIMDFCSNAIELISRAGH